MSHEPHDYLRRVAPKGSGPGPIPSRGEATTCSRRERSSDFHLSVIPFGVPGAVSQGRTRAEARGNVIDALKLMLSTAGDDCPEDALLHNEQLRLKLAE